MHSRLTGAKLWGRPEALGGLPPLMLCTKAAAHLVLVDPATQRTVEVDGWTSIEMKKRATL